MLSLFVGSKGQLFLGEEMSRDLCFPKIKNLHALNNVKFTNRNTDDYKGYTVIISKNEKVLKQKILDSTGTANSPKKILIKVSESSAAALI